MLLEQTESQLIENCRKGDRDAFRELFDRYKDKVYTVAFRYTGDPSAAEDIAQDTFVKLFARIGAFRGDAGFASWLYRLVVNSCFDHRRRSKRWLPLLLDFTRESPALDTAIRTQMSGRLSDALAALPPDQRMAVVLRYSQELSYEEIAAITGTSAGTVASRLSRALRSLEKRLRRFHA